MSFVEFVWLLLILGGIAVALLVLWAETLDAWAAWRDSREVDQ